MRVAILSITTLASIALGSVYAADYVDAANLAQATEMAAFERASVEAVRKHCGNLIPSMKRNIDYAAYIWALTNEPEFSAVDVELSTNREAFLNKLSPYVEKSLNLYKAAIADKGADQVCNGFSEQLASGERNIKNRTPNASLLLRAYLAEHPISETSRDRNNMMSGCIKRAFNKGVDLDSAMGVCECVVRVTFSELSVTERKQVDTAARAGTPIRDLEPMKRIGPKLQSCGSAEAGS